MKPPPLTDEERAIYEWQMWVPGFGEEGQRKLKGASALISRCGGLGGLVAYELAAAGAGGQADGGVRDVFDGGAGDDHPAGPHAVLALHLPGEAGDVEAAVSGHRRVSGAAACIGATEVVKLLTGLGEPLAGVMLAMDFETMQFRRVKISRQQDCAVCGRVGRASGTAIDD